MEGDAARARELVVQRGPHQGVAEAVTGSRHLDEQAGAGRLIEGGEEFVLPDTSGPLDDGGVELQPDDGRDGQELIGRLGEKRQSPADDVSYSFGNAEFAEIGAQHPAAVLLLDGTRFREVPQHLGDEERVAFRLAPHHPGQLLRLLAIETVAGGGLDEGGHCDGVEARDRQPLDLAVAPQLGEEVAQRMAPADLAVAVGADNEQPQWFRGAQNMAQQEQGGLGRPVQIVEDQQGGRLGGDSRQPGSQGIEEAVALGLGVGAERLGQACDEVGKFGEEAGEIAGIASETGIRGGGHIMAQRFHEGLIGDSEVLVAAAGQHDTSGFPDVTGQLHRQTGLADTRLAAQEGEPPVSDSGLLPQRKETLQFLVAPHEDPACSRQDARHREERPGQRRPVHLAGGNRCRQAPQVQRTDRLELMTSGRAGQCPDDLGDEDSSAPGGCTQPGRLDDGRPEAVLPLEGDVPGADSDPHLERRVARTRPVVAVECLLGRHGRGERVGRAAEGGHHAVPEVLDQPPPVRLDRARDQPVVVPP
jgi:hypothetical protein